MIFFNFAFPLPDVAALMEHLSLNLLLFVPLSRHLLPSSPPHPSPNVSVAVRPTLQTLAPIQSSTSFSQCLRGCSSHSPDTFPHPVLHILLPRYLLLFVPLSRHFPPSSPPHPSPKVSLVFLCFFCLPLFRVKLIYLVFDVFVNNSFFAFQ